MPLRHIAAMIVMSAACAFARDVHAEARLESAAAVAQESDAVRAIRAKLAESCRRNADCTKRRASTSALGRPDDPPSTPERRAALGLDAPSDSSRRSTP